MRMRRIEVSMDGESWTTFAIIPETAILNYGGYFPWEHERSIWEEDDDGSGHPPAPVEGDEMAQPPAVPDR